MKMTTRRKSIIQMNHYQIGMSAEVMHTDIKANDFPVGNLLVPRYREDSPSRKSFRGIL